MTTFESVYEAFVSKINDYNILEIEKDDLFDIYEKFLVSALAKADCINKNNKLSINFDDKCFSRDLSIKEIEILALGMIVSWREPSLNDMDNMKMRLNSKDFSQYSQANHLKELESLKILADEDFYYMINQYKSDMALKRLKKGK